MNESVKKRPASDRPRSGQGKDAPNRMGPTLRQQEGKRRTTAQKGRPSAPPVGLSRSGAYIVTRQGEILPADQYQPDRQDILVGAPL